MSLYLKAAEGDAVALHLWRDRLAWRYENEPGHWEQWCVDRLPEADRRGAAAFLGSKLHDAEIVYWESDMFAAAIEGQMAWKDEPLPEGIFPASPQLWFLGQAQTVQFTDPPWPDSQSPVLGAVALIPSDKRLLVAALMWDTARVPSPPYTIPALWEVGKPVSGGLIFLPAAAAFLTLPFIGRQKETPSRQVTRAYLRKHGHIPEFQRVILRKRQAQAGENNGDHRDFSCHFLVRGHWRKRAEAWGEGGPIYVSPHVKGDLSQPFRPPRQRLYHVAR